MTDSTSAANDITFEGAIAQTQALLDRLETEGMSESELEAAIAQLVQTENGARGFFVTYLPDERAIADQPTPAVITALQSSPDLVSELMVKNLAMSSVMALVHHQNQNEELAQGSERVRSRSLALMKQLHLPQIQKKAIALRESAATGVGDYQAFLTRWDYSAEQRQVIVETMALILAEL